MNFTHCISTPLGYMVIKGTAKYIESVEFSEEKRNSSQKLPILAKAVAQELKEYFKGKRKTFSIPLQQEGSEFQLKVWTELEKIPFGKTFSYLKLAEKLGDKKSNRAVGNANGKNQIAVIVPCHRVIGESGKLVGYAGGLWRKQWLLEHENKIENGVITLF